MKNVFITGGTGYLGRPLIQKLCDEGYPVKAVARAPSAAKLPSNCAVVIGDVLDRSSYQHEVPAGSTFVHLVGVAHPAPWKAEQFRSIDLVSLEQSVAAAKQAGAAQFVFVSVAHPAPAMKAFVAVRVCCEQIIRESGLNATILRPWYIVGPGHYWPVVLVPIYKVLETIPTTREGAVRLGLVTREQMVAARARAVASDEVGVRVVETAGIRGALPWRPEARRMAGG